MSSVHIDVGVRAARPQIRRIGPADLKTALAKGFDDFLALPTFSLFLVAVYPIVGLVLFYLTFGLGMMHLVFPLAAGFALIGPVAAIGLYELSRRRERGLSISWEAMQDLHLRCIGGIALLGITLMAIFFAWLGAAMAIYTFTFGDWVPPSVGEFIDVVFTTPSGRTLILLGCGVGLLFAIVAFTISVVSAPLLLDRDVGFLTAVETSIRAVHANPMMMTVWGLIVAGSLVIGSLPFLMGLTVVFPILGHTTWHLYRAIVET
ncbi:MAG: DUF2189 domain-containing protein [Hyphomicrobium sp.]